MVFHFILTPLAHTLILGEIKEISHPFGQSCRIFMEPPNNKFALYAHHHCYNRNKESLIFFDCEKISLFKRLEVDKLPLEIYYI